MLPFYFVLTFVLLFSLFTSSEMNRYVASNYREKGFNDYRKEAEERRLQKQKALLQHFKNKIYEEDHEGLDIDIKKHKSPKKSESESKTKKKRHSYKLNFDINRPPDNARFNMFHLLRDPDKKIGGKTYREIFEKLVIVLYRNASFFKEIPLFEKVITEELLKEKEKLLAQECADAINILSFEGEKMRLAFYKMLKGHEEYESLLIYLDLHETPTAKINPLFAPAPLILALLEHERATKRWLEFREQLIAQMREPETSLTRSEIARLLREKMGQILMEENLPKEYKQLFDYHLGKPGRLIFYHDPMTGKQCYDKILIPQALPESIGEFT